MTISGFAPTGRPFSATVSTPEQQLFAATYGKGQYYSDNVTRAWAVTAGQGVAIALIDDGFTPSILANFNDSASRSYSGTLAEAAGAFPHGTTTSGLIGANGAGDGLVGVAEGASIVGVKVAFGATPFSQFVSALGYAAQVGAVVNNSWGFNGFNPGALTSAVYASWNTAMQTAVATDRGGLGASVVFAAGNDRGTGNTVGVQPLQDDPRVITVAASNASGLVASFSDAGAGLLVAAVADGVAVPSATAGSYYIASGTSYAAPLVSGVVAMMLSVNPGLGWRDIQEILAQSAYAPTPSAASFSTSAGGGWNGGGMHFSNDLGFGVVDASVAVDLARDWSIQMTSANLSTMTTTKTTAFSVGVNATASSSLAVKAQVRIEHVQVHIDDIALPLADTKLTLISPSGTKSVLLDHAGLVGGQDMSNGTDLNGDTITSNAFWGETGSGSWTLQATDTGGAVVGTIKDWTLTIWGDNTATAATPLVYTPEFASLADASPARALVSNAGMATKTIDLVDLPGASNLNLNGGPGTLDGVSVRVAAGLSNLNAAGTTGSLSVTDAVGGSAITGGDGPTTITGDGGADTISAGAGATTFYAARDTRASFVAGSGGDTVHGGAGALTLTGGAAADILFVQRGKDGGTYTFANFEQGVDAVQLLGFAKTAPSAAVAAQIPDGHGGMLVGLGDGTRIDFVGVSHLTTAAFVV